MSSMWVRRQGIGPISSGQYQKDAFSPVRKNPALRTIPQGRFAISRSCTGILG